MLFSITGLLRTSDGVGSSVAGRPMKDLWDWSEKSILQRDRKLLRGIGCWGNATMQEEEGFIYIYQLSLIGIYAVKCGGIYVRRRLI